MTKPLKEVKDQALQILREEFYTEGAISVKTEAVMCLLGLVLLVKRLVLLEYRDKVMEVKCVITRTKLCSLGFLVGFTSFLSQFTLAPLSRTCWMFYQ